MKPVLEAITSVAIAFIAINALVGLVQPHIPLLLCSALAFLVARSLYNKHTRF